jgi:hypothetical protein
MARPSVFSLRHKIHHSWGYDLSQYAIDRIVRFSFTDNHNAGQFDLFKDCYFFVFLFLCSSFSSIIVLFIKMIDRSIPERLRVRRRTIRSLPTWSHRLWSLSGSHRDLISSTYSNARYSEQSECDYAKSNRYRHFNIAIFPYPKFKHRNMIRIIQKTQPFMFRIRWRKSNDE